MYYRQCFFCRMGWMLRVPFILLSVCCAGDEVMPASDGGPDSVHQTAPAAPVASVPAFPGAEGFGAMTPGGRGGAVLFVTNLEDYDPKNDAPITGSLRAAIESKGPRIVVFRVGGIIELKTHLIIEEPHLTLAGQSAPGAGICLKNYSCLLKNTQDIVIRYMRFRAGDRAGVELDAFSTGSGCRNIIIDHCSASWGNDETLSISGAGQDLITVQWCLITESLDRSSHQKGPHGYASLLRTDGRVTFHHNLYAHHRTRCPRPGTYGEEPGLLLDFSNNVIYNWKAPAGYTAEDPARINYIGNYLKPGPSTTDRAHAFSIGGEATKMFVSGNIVEGVDLDNGDNWMLIGKANDGHKMKEPFAVASIRTQTAQEAYAGVLRDAGATLPVRDTVDARIIAEVRTGTGRIIDSQDEVGGWPDYPGGEAPQDSDQDGMPDAWETRYRLDPNDPLDAIQDNDGDGYTNVEEFLNGTEPAGVV